jgi:hypothetical protein
MVVDLREQLFGAATWYEDLEESTEGLWVLWRVTKSSEPAWWKDVLEVAAAFAADHGLLEGYRSRFASIPLRDLTESVAKTEARSAVSPIWEIANELIVARYLEGLLGWTYEQHEPPGHRGRRGDWLFLSPTGRRTFVEVKTLVEPPPRETGVYSRGVQSARLTNVLKGAYKQLPSDDRATIVAVVGMHETLNIPYGIVHGDLFQTLYGQMQISFNVMPYDPDSARMGPSFKDRFIHGSKHRRMGCAFGLVIGGLDYPGLVGYAIHNPYARGEARCTDRDFEGSHQFWVDESGSGTELSGLDAGAVWTALALPHQLGQARGEANGR